MKSFLLSLALVAVSCLPAFATVRVQRQRVVVQRQVVVQQVRVPRQRVVVQQFVQPNHVQQFVQPVYGVQQFVAPQQFNGGCNNGALQFNSGCQAFFR